MSNTEHERKFLVADTTILANSTGLEIDQVYPWVERGWVLRVRRTWDQLDPTGAEDAEAVLTVKGPRTASSRPEYELVLEKDHAAALFGLTSRRVTKTRHPILSGELPWVVDVFHGDNEGLLVAEIELESSGAVNTVKRPWWAGAEVTNDPRYSNEYLALRPWSTWTER